MGQSDENDSHSLCRRYHRNPPTVKVTRKNTGTILPARLGTRLVGWLNALRTRGPISTQVTYTLQHFTEKSPMRFYHTNTPNGDIKRVRRGAIRRLPFLPESVEIPLRQIAQYAAQGLDELSMQVGPVVLAAMMEEEVTAFVGPKGKHVPKEERTCYRHSYEPGWVAMAGRAVSVGSRPGVPARFFPCPHIVH